MMKIIFGCWLVITCCMLIGYEKKEQVIPTLKTSCFSCDSEHDSVIFCDDFESASPLSNRYLNTMAIAEILYDYRMWAAMDAPACGLSFKKEK